MGDEMNDVVKAAADWLARYEDLLKCDIEPVMNLMLEVEKLRSLLRDLHAACDCWNAIQERNKAREALEKPLVSLPDPDRAAHRALVEAGYAPIQGYIKRYGEDK